MARTISVVRDAGPGDAPALLTIWQDFTAVPPRQPRPHVDVGEVVESIERIAADPVQRLLVAVVGGQPVGVAHLRCAPLSPIQPESAVHVGYLHVMSEHRRHGLGRQLLEAAADWAEQVGSPHIVAVVAANAREANRFLTRLGMAQMAVVRSTTVGALRTRLSPTRPGRLPALVSARRVRRLNDARQPAGR